MFAALALALSVAAEPPEPRLVTPWAAQVDPDNVLPEYPRPQMARENWANLNGKWDYAIRSIKEDQPPGKADGQILVPFPVESHLSGVGRRVKPDQRLWYRRKFTRKPQEGKRTLLHFGAVDWHTQVYVNGRIVGEHKGGYDPFTFDITNALEKSGEQELVVAVTDPTDTQAQPRGKQVSQPGGIWYTPVTGIWQTVWLETVPDVYIKGLKIVPDVDAGQVTVQIKSENPRFTAVRVTVKDGGQPIGTASMPFGGKVTIPVKEAKLWTPDSPHLYRLTAEILSSTRYGKTVDTVESYFAMRKVSLTKSATGVTLLALNNKPVFHWGPLDQGSWPDGLYTAPTDDALKYDIEVTKRLGFNMIRKHVKVEPARWYYHCDRLGVLVWQDMPNGHPRGKKGLKSLRVPRGGDKDADRPAESAKQFEKEWKAVIDALHNHPSIVMWVPFNEGWGQYDTKRIAFWTKRYDPTRLVNCPSGWEDRGVGDVHDIHAYPGPKMPPLSPARAAVLGEFGGLGWPAEDHLWGSKRNWGYRTYKDRATFNKKYAEVVGKVEPLVKKGLAAAVYTQTTDVEGEVNGLMTYDRKVIKIDAGAARALAKKLLAATPPAR